MRAVWNKQTSERCKKISKWTSKWRSTHVLISKTSESLCPPPTPSNPFLSNPSSATPSQPPHPLRRFPPQRRSSFNKSKEVACVAATSGETPIQSNPIHINESKTEEQPNRERPTRSRLRRKRRWIQGQVNKPQRKSLTFHQRYFIIFDFVVRKRFTNELTL